MDAQHLPRDLVRPGSGYKELAQTMKKGWCVNKSDSFAWFTLIFSYKRKPKSYPSSVLHKVDKEIAVLAAYLLLRYEEDRFSQFNKIQNTVMWSEPEV